MINKTTRFIIATLLMMLIGTSWPIAGFALEDYLPDKKMKKIVFKDTSPKSKETSSETIVTTTLYRMGDKYARIETSVPSLRFPLVMIINEPDGWVVDPYNKTATHIVDPDVNGKFYFPIEGPFPELEFGTEFDFMKAGNADKSLIEIDDVEYDLFSVEMYGVKIELISEKDKHLPHLIRFWEKDKIVSSFLYDEYKLDLKPDLSLFEIPADLTIVEAPQENMESIMGSKEWEGEPSTEAKGWALGCGAVLTEANNQLHDSLAPREIDEKSIQKQKNSMEEWWGITGRLSFFDSIDWIKGEGHRKGFNDWAQYIAYLSEQGYKELLEDNKGNEDKLNKIKIVKEYYKELEGKNLLGWDYSRYINLCRWAYMVGYITGEEAWQMIMPVAEMLQNTFDSWEDLGRNYIIGREFWSREQTEKNGYMYEDAYQRLIDMPSSPWNKYPWDMDLHATTVSDTGIKVYDNDK